MDQSHFSLHEFSGYLRVLEDRSNIVIDKEYISVKNVAWSGCEIKNNEILGLVIGVGNQTRL